MSSNRLDFRNRPALFAAAELVHYDMLIIGAGITGCGIARDAAMRGMKVLLVDANDIAAGTSSRSSKLVHGGMRYMAAGQLTVVKEAAVERKTLRRIAPHLAQRTNMLVPVPSKGAYVKFKAAMVAYEKLGEVEKENRHEFWDRDTLAEREPEVLGQDWEGAVVYPEYITDDARLTLANARGAAESGADVLTYAPVLEILVEEGKAVGAVLGDALGELGARVKAKVVVNAAGPWLDVVRKLEDNGAPDLLQLTKGIHVVLKRERLPIDSTVILQASDKRSNFVVPRGEYVYFGTTDTFYPDADYWPEISREDILYLFDSAQRVFRGAPYSDKDIVSLWSGVRPLLAQSGKKPSEISRKNEILHGTAGILAIAGGKLTSYRSMAERIVDECADVLGQSFDASSTADTPLPGGEFDGDLVPLMATLQQQGLTAQQAERGARLYGSEAVNVFSGDDALADEVTHAVLNDGAVTLEDVWVRRTARARFADEGGLTLLEPMALTMAGLLDWSEAERDAQVDACRAIRDLEMGVLNTQGV